MSLRLHSVTQSGTTVDLSPVINNVSVSLYGAAASLQPEGNLLLSPISILYSVVLVYLGARGSTRDNLYTALDFQEFSKSGTDGDIAAAFGQLMNNLKVKTTPNAILEIKPAEDGVGPDADHPEYRVQLALANGVFLRKDLKIDDNYLATVSQNLKAAIQTKDFNDDPEKSREDINKWIAERTGGHITDLLPPGAIDKASATVLANAIYFKSRWERIFDQDQTEHNATFHLLNGDTSTVDMMRMTQPRFPWHYTEDAQLDIQYVEIPYMDKEASLLVLLPKKTTGLRTLEKQLTAEAMRDLATKAEQSPTKVILNLPKFKVESSFDMVALLKLIGVTNIFAEDADLSGMVPSGDTFVDKAYHKTVIDLNEEGTEAAGASGSLTRTRAQAFDLMEFVADHPFMYAIRHNPTKAILFMGRFEKSA